MTSKKSKVLKGIITDFLLMGSKTFKQIVFIPVILFYVGSQNYGDYITIVAYSGLFSLFDINFSLYFTRELSKKNNKIEKEQLVTTALILMVINVIITFLIGFILISILETLTNYILFSKYYFFFIILLIIKMLNISIGFCAALLNSLFKMAFMNSVRAIIIFIELAICLVMFRLDFGLKSLFYAEIIATSLIFIVLFIYSLRFFDIKINFPNYKIVKQAIDYSFSHYLMKISKLGLSNLDSIVIHYFLGANLVTLYNISIKLPILISREITGKISSNIFSTVSSLDLKDKTRTFKNLFSKLNYFIFRLGFISAITLFFINKNFVEIWIGGSINYNENLTPVFCFIVIVEIIYFFHETLLLAQDNISKLGKVSLIELFANITLSLILVQFYGVVGVALASLLSKLIISFSYVIIRVKKIFRIDFPSVSFYKNIFYSIIATFTLFYFFEDSNRYLLLILGILLPVTINLIAEDFKIFLRRKLTIKDKFKLILFGETI